MIYLIYSAIAIIFFLIGRSGRKRRPALNVKPDFSGDLIFEDIVVRKKESEVWCMYENRPVLMAVNYVSCSNGVNGVSIQYNLRLKGWSKGCIGIEKITESQMFDSKEALLNSL